MTDRLDLTVRDVQREIDELLLSFPDMKDDEELRADVLEGQTNLHEVLSQVVHLARENRAGAAAAKAKADAYVQALRSHQNLCERRAEAWKKLALSLVERAGGKVKLPDGALYAYHKTASPVITDINALPDEYVKKEPKLADLGVALRAGETIPGAVLGNPGRSLRGL